MTLLIKSFSFLNNLIYTHSHWQRWKSFSGAVIFIGLGFTLLFGFQGSRNTSEGSLFATLPPTWTPVPSLTPSRTPIPTATPSPTLSPTPTQTPSAEEICEQFRLTGAPVEALHVDYRGIIGFSWEYAPEDSAVVLSIAPLAGGEETLIGYLPFEGFNAIFHVEQLPGWGTYEWTISILREADGELCPVSGTFTRDPWWIEPLENPLAPPFAY